MAAAIEFADGGKTFVISPKGRGGSHPLLYGGERLADLHEGQTVWIVEGEKCVDRMCELGAIAVSGDTGAQSKWLPEHAELLRGLQVILWRKGGLNTRPSPIRQKGRCKI